jgi:DNA-binding XRE family transcriptional regulator
MSLKKIFQESPKRSTKNRQIENKNKTQAVIDEPTLFLDMDKLLAKYPNKEICGVKIDLRRINDKRYLVKKLYQIILDPDRPTDAASVQWRVNVIRCLENMLRTDFKNTRDFKRKIENYLKNYEIRKGSAADRIKKARKKLRLTQEQAAEHLGFKTHVTFVNYEKGKRYPPDKVFRWLEEVGV